LTASDIQGKPDVVVHEILNHRESPAVNRRINGGVPACGEDAVYVRLLLDGQRLTTATPHNLISGKGNIRFPFPAHPAMVFSSYSTLNSEEPNYGSQRADSKSFAQFSLSMMRSFFI
jgi:hypothetical protein